MASTDRPTRLWWWVVHLGLLNGVLALVLWQRLRPPAGWVDDPDAAAEVIPLSFDGGSDKLQHTVVVPTLDTPLPDGKSAVWCSSFQLAWNRLKTDVVKGPVQMQDAGDVVERLNRAEQSEKDLVPEAYFAAAGWVEDGIVGKILTEMASRFPGGPTPALGGVREGGVAYAYLRAGVRYKYPFFNNTEPFRFTDASGRQTAVRAFGIRKEDTNKDGHRETFRGQVALYSFGGDEFAADLSKESTPNQIVLARIRRRNTLAETFAVVHDRLKGAAWGQSLGEEDTLLVPLMHWRIEHHFRELEGKRLLNPGLPGLPLGGALQTIEFKMDRYGAEVVSEALVVWLNGGPKHYHFDRPFLIYLKKRDAQHPFFVMWVDNAELLGKR
jgi:hypothetical protein